MTAGREKRIAIIGLGLMGGSLGCAFVRNGLEVTGWDNDPEVIAEAYQVGAINILPLCFESAVAAADYIFIATPVAIIPGIIRDCLPHAAPGTVFSDLGSIKEQIMEAVFAFLPPEYYFVPGHPMTGSEKHGISAIDPFLFENAAYIVIRDSRTPEQINAGVVELIKCTGAHIIDLAAAEHDRIVGMVSHLPHLIAVVLADTAGRAEEAHPGTLALAAGGFRDTTRVATGSPGLWEEIIRGNRTKVLESIDAFEQQLQTLRQIVAADDRMALLQFLERAREVRLQIPAKNKGFLSLLYEMVVTIEDRPGTIEAVLRYLSQAEINIKDIEILRIREGEGGTLRLAFENDTAVDKAVALLESQGFKAWRR
ncbi:MAG TPA: prephenate dehydrogenase [Bacillota bacterium]|nr:prephenate dehydrogenase [Bacillota bacterium]